MLQTLILAETFLGTQVSNWQYLQNNFSLHVKYLRLLVFLVEMDSSSFYFLV